MNNNKVEYFIFLNTRTTPICARDCCVPPQCDDEIPCGWNTCCGYCCEDDDCLGKCRTYDGCQEVEVDCEYEGTAYSLEELPELIKELFTEEQFSDIEIWEGRKLNLEIKKTKVEVTFAQENN